LENEKGGGMSPRRNDNTQRLTKDAVSVIFDKLDKITDDIEALRGEVVEVKTHLGYTVGEAFVLRTVDNAVDRAITKHSTTCTVPPKHSAAQARVSEALRVTLSPDALRVIKAIAVYVLIPMVSLLTGVSIKEYFHEL
jgi:regulator of replication initiation timing